GIALPWPLLSCSTHAMVVPLMQRWAIPVATQRMKPLAPISNPARVALGILFFVLFFAVWGYATLGGYVSKTFLADPLTMVEEGWLLLTKHGFLLDIGITIWRVLGGVVLAALLPLPVRLLLRPSKPLPPFLQPLSS